MNLNHPNRKAYDARRQKASVARWKKIAELRAQGVPVMTVAARFRICQSRVSTLEQKWHSYRLSNRAKQPNNSQQHEKKP